MIIINYGLILYPWFGSWFCDGNISGHVYVLGHGYNHHQPKYQHYDKSDGHIQDHKHH